MAEEDEERRREAVDSPAAVGEPEEVVYKTKVVHFLGRSTPIVLQNDNGPCPLLAICNVLLLRNHLNLSLDASEVSLQKLLSLIAERLIDSNSNVQDKDDGYLNNQQQNIADAIDLLPRLATGIDVNVHFRKINDFEFTRECAIFDLLDIGLYHGWIVDPQDADLAAVIGSKSYNTLVGELVTFATRNSGLEDNSNLGEDSVDFAAATTATLGVPSPSLSRAKSFEEAPVATPIDQGRRGDREEVEELMRVLNFSRAELPTAVDVSMPPDADGSSLSPSSLGMPNILVSGSGNHDDSSVAESGNKSESTHQIDLPVPLDCGVFGNCHDNNMSMEVSKVESNAASSKSIAADNAGSAVPEGSGQLSTCSDSIESVKTDMSIQGQDLPFQSIGVECDGFSVQEYQEVISGLHQSPSHACSTESSTSQIHEKPSDNLVDCGPLGFSASAATCADADSSSGGKEILDTSEGISSNLLDTEPMYEGEECILDPHISRYEDREPVYEGEMVLAEQADKKDENNMDFQDEIAQRKWNLIKNFLENSASQLTIYGLFCLQEGLRERELCVFFRNNHFSTMFKYNGELYLLATDQGYLNQPDLVWEKLNEVNGDTVFMTGNFKEFKIENPINDSWNEQNAMTSTADYIAALESSERESSTLNSDLQLAIALQQQEFEQQPQRQQQPQQPPQQQNLQQPTVGRSRLITGPQVPRSSHAPQKNDSKSKDKCSIM